MEKELLTGINGNPMGAAEISNEVDNAAREAVNRPATPEEKEIAEKFAGNIQRKVYANKHLSQEQLVNASSLPVNTVEKWKRKELVFDDGNFYVRKAIVGGTGSVIPVFTSSMDMEAGITNIDKQKLEECINLALKRIEFNYDQSTSVTSAKKAEFAPLSASNKDTALMNGELEVLVGTSKICSIPINQFQEGIANMNCPQNGVNFKQPKLIKERETIQINLVIPVGELLASNEGGTLYHFVEVVFKGAISKVRTASGS
jgi:hypothetical protein